MLGHHRLQLTEVMSQQIGDMRCCWIVFPYFHSHPLRCTFASNEGDPEDNASIALSFGSK
jgi:hypothetical protein